MADFSTCRMTGDDWYGQYIGERGCEALDSYIHAVYSLLQKMKPGSFFDISKNVKPGNIDLFIKICCLFILEQRRARKEASSYYVFSEDYTKIIHHE